MTMRKLGLVHNETPAQASGPCLRVAIATQDGKAMNAMLQMKR